MTVNGEETLKELSVEQAGARGNLLPGNPDIVAKPTLLVDGAPDEMDQLTAAAANMAIVATAEQLAAAKKATAEQLEAAKKATAQKLEAAKKERIIERKELDTIFAGSMLKDKVPAIKMPAALKVELFPYQQDGVSWLVHQENNVDSVPPFWKERKSGSKTKWWCHITKEYLDNKPAPIRGSILADGTCIVCGQSAESL
jgi:SNF2 family DNA or RNA helicase